ncbi:MAG: hypothetical protein K2K19_10520, partial [Acetatifactor sp.]|nr:hypothetical protein [Acetatifactor sp.]
YRRQERGESRSGGSPRYGWYGRHDVRRGHSRKNRENYVCGVEKSTPFILSPEKNDLEIFLKKYLN